MIPQLKTSSPANALRLTSSKSSLRWLRLDAGVKGNLRNKGELNEVFHLVFRLGGADMTFWLTLLPVRLFSTIWMATWSDLADFSLALAVIHMSREKVVDCLSKGSGKDTPASKVEYRCVISVFFSILIKIVLKIC